MRFVVVGQKPSLGVLVERLAREADTHGHVVAVGRGQSARRKLGHARHELHATHDYRVVESQGRPYLSALEVYRYDPGFCDWPRDPEENAAVLDAAGERLGMSYDERMGIVADVIGYDPRHAA